MSLRTKTFLAIGVTLGALTLVMYLSSHFFLLDNYVALEKYNGITDVNRAANALDEQLDNLDTITRDWAYWDQSYAFVQDGNPAFIETNTVGATFENLNVNIMMLYNNSGKLVYGKAYDIAGHKEVPVPADFYQALRQNNKLLKHDGEKSLRRGFIFADKTPLLLSCRPILDSNGNGPVHGTLIVGRFLDSALIKQLAATTRLDLSFTPYPIWWSSLSANEKSVLKNSPAGKITTRVINQDHLQGSRVLNDINGKPALVLSVNLPRSLLKQGQTSMHYFLISLLIFGLVFGLVAMFWVERIILSRLLKLNRNLREIKGFESGNIRMDISGRDEISMVGRSINSMLDTLEQAHTQLIYNEIYLHRITENMRDTLCQVNRNGTFEYCSPSVYSNLGYPPEDLIGSSIFDLIHPEEKDFIEAALKEIMTQGYTTASVCRVRHAQGHYIWMESSGSLLYESDSENISGAVIVSRDITQRKMAEDNLIYMSEHDPLTNLYNRVYIRRQIIDFTTEPGRDYGIICFDINGLRLINDTMSYETGDKLVLIIAELLAAHTPDNAILAHTGGDEFTMFLPHAGNSLVDSTCQNIVAAIEKYNQDHPDLPVSLAIGSALALQTKSIHDVLVEAVNNMFRDKLHQNSSGQNAIVSSLMQAMLERDFITSGHADRMEKLVANMGAICQLSTSQINDLRLLARFHDIGKVAIKDSILFKRTSLTPEEKNQMQRHSEIGYRIAQAAPNLRHIADWILKHHEWWNGEGYPLGLKGEEIPMQCRILAIADAYDAMTSERPYRQPLSHEAALEELRRCAGSQFDPWLTVDFIHMWQQDDKVYGGGKAGTRNRVG